MEIRVIKKGDREGKTSTRTVESERISEKVKILKVKRREIRDKETIQKTQNKQTNKVGANIKE